MDESTIRARPASAIVLARQRDASLEYLFVKRPQSMRFLAGFHAFPGGALHDEDRSERLLALSAIGREEASVALGADAGDEPPLAFYACALRELFEEVGVLLATREGQFIPVDEVADMHEHLNQGASFTTLLEQRELVLATDRIHYQARWIAPEVLPIRFDLRVFVAEAISFPHVDSREVESVEWLTPSEITAQMESGNVMLAPPTVATIDSLRPYEDVASLLRHEQRKDVATLERLAPMVRRIVAPNASVMTGPGTNTYLVGDASLIVIDPGSMDPAHLEAIAGAGPVEAIFVTHGHPDHFSGALDLSQMTSAPVFGSSQLWQASGLASEGKVIGDADVFETGEVTLEVVTTPGHSSDHICLWMEAQRALFSGDLVLGEGTTVISPPDGNLAEYLDSLAKVRRLSPRALYPGHFAPRTDASEWIDWYIAHRIEREAQIMENLGSPKTIPELVREVYAGYPAAVLPVAERSVLAHLDKLVEEGRVVEAEGVYVIRTD